MESVHYSQNLSSSNAIDSAETFDDQKRQASVMPSINTLSDSNWYKYTISNEPHEYLPPIARAMKNMLENDVFIWNSDAQADISWPHFINQYRMIQDKALLRNLYGKNEYPSPSPERSAPSFSDMANTKKLNMELEDANKRTKNKTDRYSSNGTMTTIKQDRKASPRHFIENSFEHSQNVIYPLRLIDTQLLLKPPKFSFKGDKHTSRESKQILQKKSS